MKAILAGLTFFLSAQGFAQSLDSAAVQVSLENPTYQGLRFSDAEESVAFACSLALAGKVIPATPIYHSWVDIDWSGLDKEDVWQVDELKFEKLKVHHFRITGVHDPAALKSVTCFGVAGDSARSKK